MIIIIIIKRISRAPIYHTKWQHGALYNNTNHTHARAHTHTHTHTHTASNEGMGRAIKKQFRNNLLKIKPMRRFSGSAALNLLYHTHTLAA